MYQNMASPFNVIACPNRVTASPFTDGSGAWPPPKNNEQMQKRKREGDQSVAVGHQFSFEIFGSDTFVEDETLVLQYIMSVYLTFV